MDSGDAAKVRVFPPAIPLVAIVAASLLHYWLPIGPDLDIPDRVRMAVGIVIIVASVLGLGLWSVVLFRKGGQSENPWKPTSHIERRGPYRMTRNPMYLQMVLVCVGVAIAFANGWLMLAIPFVAWALQRFAIEPEERYLTAKFGSTYREYQRSVRRWI